MAAGVEGECGECGGGALLRRLPQDAGRGGEPHRARLQPRGLALSGQVHWILTRY